jgi:hypothetical protein
MAPDMEAVSKMETEADDCRRLAAKFKRKAESARLSVKRAFFSGLERRYLLLAQVFEKEAEELRAKQGSQTSDKEHDRQPAFGAGATPRRRTARAAGREQQEK